MQNDFTYCWGVVISWVKFSSCWMVHSAISWWFTAGQGGGGGSRQRKWQRWGAESNYPGWHWARGTSRSPPAKITTSSLLPPSLGSREVGHWAGTWRWLRMKLSAHHHPGTSNSSCWCWDQGCWLSIHGLDTSFCVAVFRCSFLLVAMGRSPTTLKLSFLSSYLPTAHIHIFPICLHIKRHFTTSLCYPAEFMGKADMDPVCVKGKKISSPFAVKGYFFCHSQVDMNGT